MVDSFSFFGVFVSSNARGLELYASCFEIKKTMDQLLAFPTELQVRFNLFLFLSKASGSYIFSSFPRKPSPQLVKPTRQQTRLLLWYALCFLNHNPIKFLNSTTGHSKPCRLAICCRAAVAAGRGRSYSRPRCRYGQPVNKKYGKSLKMLVEVALF